uniref:Uncharacterized protein n=1 Tax=Megaselia scalaris TaxID=36166 RepID=T1GHI8_MEGSC
MLSTLKDDGTQFDRKAKFPNYVSEPISSKDIEINPIVIPESHKELHNQILKIDAFGKDNLQPIKLGKTWSYVKVDCGILTVSDCKIQQGDSLSCSYFNILLEIIMKAPNFATSNINPDIYWNMLMTSMSFDVIFLEMEKVGSSNGLMVIRYMLSSREQRSHN